MNISNLLSFLRAPLALLFILENTALRVTVIILAMLTDSIDGYLARKNKSVSKFGAILDPAMDKFFVYFVLSFLFIQNKIELWQAFAMISRDFFLFVYAVYLTTSRGWKNIELKPARWGKVTTAMQFFLLIALSLNYTILWQVYCLFILFGILAFIELLQIKSYSKI